MEMLTILTIIFSDQKFQKEINTDNPLGMGGKLALTFAVLMKVIWSGKSYSHAPSKLKAGFEFFF